MQVTRRCCTICEDAGIRYARKSYLYRWVRNAASMLRLIDQVVLAPWRWGCTFIRATSSRWASCLEMVVYEVGDRVFHTHLSDNDGASNVHWRPGKGKIDWRAVLQALQAVGYDNVLSIELEDVPASRGPARH